MLGCNTNAKQVKVNKVGAARYLGNGFQNLINLLFKVHVQQPVSLIQHQMLEQLETEALQIDVAFSLKASGKGRKINTVSS